jgi:23S rRNA (pseudouridine1915-N3)-methyltransferase
MARLSGHIIIASVGKLKHKPWRLAQDDYLTRLQRYTQIQLVEVKDVVGRHIPDQVGMAREGEQLLKVTAVANCRIALTPAGKLMRSQAWARFLQQQIEQYGRLAFLIGGPLGFSDEVLDACEVKLSLSPLTFPHELARVILLEQLYRAATIVAGEKYHK